ncbi:hypothetical protein W02_36550 [Nitrospira sp. KM1]|uniref:hypothetical protein n=1 Tax=Nitrospira sp. KM1 TaxID=1936990 RepID=UPI0013A72D19|nr:hypothetical protein [Nitrospira sp. KM1]BCA56515.1 hypothetical protein W02_36550 [Nitrospira sp. KM1]
MSVDRKWSRSICIGIAGLFVMCWGGSGHAEDRIVPIEKILWNPSAYHRHEVVLKGGLTQIGRWDSKDMMGRSTCGPIFTLQDDTGAIPIFYFVLCEPKEVDRVSAFAGSQVVVYATIESETVMHSADGAEFRIRGMASKIRRENQ